MIKDVPYIYKTTILKTGKSYIGKHNGSLKNYYGSGKDFKIDFKKFVNDKSTDLIKEIIEYVYDINELNNREEYWLKFYDAKDNPLFYNLTNKSGGIDRYSIESRNKISMSQKGKKKSPLSDATKLKISKANKGHKHSFETKYKMSLIKKGKPQSEESILKRKKPRSESAKINMRVPKKNKENFKYPKPQSTKDAISKSKKGHKCYENPEIGLKISKSLKGYKQTLEHVNKRTFLLKGKSNEKNKKPKPQGFGDLISRTNKGKPHLNLRKPILQYDLEDNFIKEWDSITQACLELFNDLSKNPNINKCIHNKIKTAYGYKWKKS